MHFGSEGRNLSAIGAMENAYSRPTFSVTSTSRNAREVFCSVLRSIDAASTQILSNAKLTLIVVCDVTFVHLELYFYGIKITLATGRLINIDKLAFD